MPSEAALKLATLIRDVAGIILDIGVFPTANYADFAAFVEAVRTRLIDIETDTGAITWGDITGIVNDLGVFPTANYATFAAFVEDVRTRLIAIPTGPALVSDGWDAALATILDNFTGVLIGNLAELDFDLQTTLSTLQTDITEGKLRTFRRTYAFVSTSESVANAAEVSLAAPAVVTVTFPAGATLLEAKVVAAIKANNQTAAEHNIGVTLQKNVAGGGWVDIRDFTANPPLTLPDVDATADALTLVEALAIATGQTVQFRWQVDSDNAGEVHYTQTFVLSVEYDFQ